jgi:hypothetical protein
VLKLEKGFQNLNHKRLKSQYFFLTLPKRKHFLCFLFRAADDDVPGEGPSPKSRSHQSVSTDE